MSCSYADIATADFDKEDLEYHLSPQRGKCLEIVFLYFGRMLENL